MTQEEIKIGEEWIGILAKYTKDFSTKALFNSTSSYVKTKASGQKKFSLSKDQGTLKKDIEETEEELKQYSLLEAARIRAENDDEPTNLLATSEDDFIPRKRKSKNV